MNSKLRLPAFISVFLTVFPLLMSSFIVYYILKNESVLAAFGWEQWLLLSIVFIATSIIALTPPTLLAMVYGYFLSFWALPYLFFLNMAAISLVYFITNKWLGDVLLQVINQNSKAQKIVNDIKSDELKVIFLAKLSPVLPFALTNFVFALSGARFRNIFLGGFFGMIPRTTLAVWVGMEASEIKTLLENPNQNTWQQLVVLMLVIVSTFGLIRVLRRAIQ